MQRKQAGVQSIADIEHKQAVQFVMRENKTRYIKVQREQNSRAYIRYKMDKSIRQAANTPFFQSVPNIIV